MAITKIHSITATLDSAIEYISNPNKTDGQLLVSTFGCSLATACWDFQSTQKYSTGQGENLAHHLIQSFSPEDNVTPELAHKIGMKLADKLLQGRYEYVLATHVDKGHIHNHIIINSVNMDNFKMFEYEHNRNKQAYQKIRKLSDELCSEYGLSVIQNSERGRGKSHYEWEQDKQGISWKSHLRKDIDSTIKLCTDLNDFIDKMQEQGYEIKRGKYISFRADGQQRFIRSKTLGWYYTQDEIEKRLAYNERKKNPYISKRKVGLVVDIENNIKCQQSAGFEHWATINNLQQMSKTINFLTENNIKSYDDLIDKIEQLNNDFYTVSDGINATEKEIKNQSKTLQLIKDYKRTKPINDKYKKVIFKDRFFREHEDDLMTYDLSLNNLRSIFKDGNQLPKIDVLDNQIDNLLNEKIRLNSQYKEIHKMLSEIKIVKQNVDMALDKTQNRQRELEREQEREL